MRGKCREGHNKRKKGGLDLTQERETELTIVERAMERGERLERATVYNQTFTAGNFYSKME